MAKKLLSISMVIFFAVAAAMAGCESMGENTQRGAIGGGLVGSVIGGIVGHQSGHGIEGAAIGAGVGAITGGVIGDKIDTKEAKATATSGEKMGISDVITLCKAGLSDDAVIQKIRDSGSVYNLTVEEIELLRKEGVSSIVVNFMMDTTKN